MTDDPTSQQTSTLIAGYLDNLEVGDEVAIRNVQGGHLTFTITQVTAVSRDHVRIFTERSAHIGGYSWFVCTGRNCGAPDGPSCLVVPTEAVRRFKGGRVPGVGILNFRPEDVDVTLDTRDGTH